MASQKIKVFVYGTLKRGEPNHSTLSTESNGFAEFMCGGKTIEKFPLVVIDEKMLNHLDTLEIYPQLYNRHILNVNGLDGNIHQCWIYTLDQYPEEFAEKYEFRVSYRNSVEYPYVKSSGDPNDNLLR